MKILLGILVNFLLVGFAAQAPAAPIPGPPRLDARAYVLMDFDSGSVIAEKDKNAPMEPASLTKIMTIYAVARELELKTLSLDDEVTVSEKAWRMPGSRMFIEVGKKVRLEDLMMGDIIQSGNDASVALAEHVSGTEDVFAALMNQHAERLGMSSTNYVNSTGLPHPEHITSAYDIALLSRALIREFPDIYSWFSIREFTYNGIKQNNRNRLLSRDETVDGIKTGYTENAGFCLAASAARDGQRLISVVMGTESDNGRLKSSQALLNYGFRFFETHKLYGPQESVTDVRVWKGDTDRIDLGLSEALYVTIPRGQYENLDATMSIDSRIIAPIAVGKQLGTLEVKLGTEAVAQRPLLALGAVKEGGTLERLIDQVQLLFE